MSFNHLGLRVELLKAIKKQGFTEPTPVQNKAIPLILGGRDILACAQTGTGKTDAFALPVVEILSRTQALGSQPRALILAPTRELALQVGECVKAYGRRVSLRCTVIYGGVRKPPQVDRLKRGVDILVATPGRLLDLAGTRHLDLSRIEFLVFDEADRMLDLGFSREISEIIDLVPAERRTMLFSATYNSQIRELAGKMLEDPEHIEVAPENTVTEFVTQKVHMVKRSVKRDLLVHLIKEGDLDRVLVFVRTRHGANRIVDQLATEGVAAHALHGDKSQSLRTRTLEEFRRGEITVLIATDLAARGLDINDLSLVVNFDMPRIPEDYIHRTGRTGRAGVRGVAISLVCNEEKVELLAIENLIRQKIKVEKVDGYTMGSDVPDFVMFRPEDNSGGNKSDKDLREIVELRELRKEKSKKRKAGKSGAGKKTASKTKFVSGIKSEKPASGRRSDKPASGRRSDKPASGRRSDKPASGRRSDKPASGRKTGRPSSSERTNRPGKKTQTNRSGSTRSSQGNRGGGKR